MDAVARSFFAWWQQSRPPAFEGHDSVGRETCDSSAGAAAAEFPSQPITHPNPASQNTSVIAARRRAGPPFFDRGAIIEGSIQIKD